MFEIVANENKCEGALLPIFIEFRFHELACEGENRVDNAFEQLTLFIVMQSAKNRSLQKHVLCGSKTFAEKRKRYTHTCGNLSVLNLLSFINP